MLNITKKKKDLFPSPFSNYSILLTLMAEQAQQEQQS